ncbi:hypothetical protein FRC12_018254 [Ceratobasidium sp. 428]|nr:hypothetical protein FRC12_018254 [Ceratobasidium sp. 428]
MSADGSICASNWRPATLNASGGLSSRLRTLRTDGHGGGAGAANAKPSVSSDWDFEAAGVLGLAVKDPLESPHISRSVELPKAGEP